MASVLAGTKYRGEFEERIRDVLAEIRRCGNMILFVDEMHTLVGAGQRRGRDRRGEPCSSPRWGAASCK